MKPNKYFAQIVNSFEQKHNFQATYREIDQQYLLHPFKIKNFCTKKLLLRYKILTKRYQTKRIEIWEEDWHKSQRKVFIQFLICFCKKLVHVKKIQIQDQWSIFSTIFFKKKAMFLKFQGLSIQKKSKKVQWEKSEDKLLRDIVEAEGQRNWNQLSKKLFYSTNFVKYFSPKKVRERWFNHLSQNIKHGDWTLEEDVIILEHIENENKHWCQIVKILNHTRTEHMVKNRYLFLIRPQKNWKPEKEMKSVIMILSNLRKKLKAIKNQEKPKLIQFQPNRISETQQDVEQINNQPEKQIKLKNKSTENSGVEAKGNNEGQEAKQNCSSADNFTFSSPSFGIFISNPYTNQCIMNQDQTMGLYESGPTLSSNRFYSPPFLMPAGNIYMEQSPQYSFPNYYQPMFTYMPYMCYNPGQFLINQELRLSE